MSPRTSTEDSKGSSLPPPVKAPQKIPETKLEDDNLDIWGNPKDETYWRMFELVKAHHAQLAEQGLNQGWYLDPFEEAEWDPVAEAIERQELEAWTAAQKETQSSDASSSSVLPFIPYQDPRSSRPGTPAAPESPVTLTKPELPVEPEQGENLERHIEQHLSLNNSLSPVTLSEDQSPIPRSDEHSEADLQPAEEHVTQKALDLDSGNAQLPGQEKTQKMKKGPLAILKAVTESNSAAKPDPQLPKTSDSAITPSLGPDLLGSSRCTEIGPASASAQPMPTDTPTQPAGSMEIESEEIRSGQTSADKKQW